MTLVNSRATLESYFIELLRGNTKNGGVFCFEDEVILRKHGDIEANELVSFAFPSLDWATIDGDRFAYFYCSYHTAYGADMNPCR